MTANKRVNVPCFVSQETFLPNQAPAKLRGGKKKKMGRPSWEEDACGARTQVRGSEERWMGDS